MVGTQRRVEVMVTCSLLKGQLQCLPQPAWAELFWLLCITAGTTARHLSSHQVRDCLNRFLSSTCTSSITWRSSFDATPYVWSALSRH